MKTFTFRMGRSSQEICGNKKCVFCSQLNRAASPFHVLRISCKFKRLHNDYQLQIVHGSNRALLSHRKHFIQSQKSINQSEAHKLSHNSLHSSFDHFRMNVCVRRTAHVCKCVYVGAREWAFLNGTSVRFMIS